MQMAKLSKLTPVEAQPKVEAEVMPPASMSAEETSFRYDLDATIAKAAEFTADLRKELGKDAD